MNMSQFLTRIKLNLGLMSLVSPYKEEINQTMQEIIENITIPDFSIYSPRKQIIHVNTADLELVDKAGDHETYLLPEFRAVKILYLVDCSYDQSIMSGLGYYGGGLPLMEGSMIPQMMLANAGASVMNLVIPKLTWNFNEPRDLTIYNAYHSSKIVLELGVEHAKNMATIPETSRNSILKLAELDVKKGLYETLKYYTEINTAIGTINLKLDDWANAAQARDELTNSWDDNVHLDGKICKPVYYI